MLRFASLQLDQIHAHDLRCVINMPSETISIPLKSLPTYEASAVFFSTIAYPDPRDESQREKFRLALSRWAIVQRTTIDGQWGRVAQAIKPEIFSQRERLFLRSYERGLDLLVKRFLCATVIVLPLLPKTPRKLYGFEPTVGNLVSILASHLKMSPESHKTIELRYWARTKPVAHAATAWVWVLMHALTDKETLELANQLGYHGWLLRAFFDPEMVTLLVKKAEKIRLRLPEIRRFRINEEIMIQFVLD